VKPFAEMIAHGTPIANWLENTSTYRDSKQRYPMLIWQLIAHQAWMTVLLIVTPCHYAMQYIGILIRAFLKITETVKIIKLTNFSQLVLVFMKKCSAQEL
jgi:hypothetical protein